MRQREKERQRRRIFKKEVLGNCLPNYQWTLNKFPTELRKERSVPLLFIKEDQLSRRFDAKVDMILYKTKDNINNNS